MAAYSSRVDAFVHMLAAQANDFEHFYAYVEQLGKLDQARRDRCLDSWELDSVATAKDCSPDP